MAPGLTDYQIGLDSFEAVAATVNPVDWNNPSPCPGWNAKAIVGHLIDGQRMIISILERNERPEPAPQPATVAGEHPVQALLAQRQRTDQVLAEIALSAMISTPGGDAPIGTIIGQAALEPLVHAWDLAIATGADFTPDPGLAQRLLEQLLPVIDAISATGMYGTQRKYSGRDPFHQLLALLGRNPIGS